jgi:hypothetical protein
MIVNTDELGNGIIGNYLREADHWNLRSENELKRDIAKLIIQRISTKDASGKDAESLGVRCARPPGTECSYSGEVSYRLGGLPQNSPHQGKKTIVTIRVLFSYLKPEELVVEKREREIAAE